MNARKLVSRIRHSGLVTRWIDYEARKKSQVVKRFRCPFGLPTIDILELLPGLEETISPYSFLDGAASPIDMAILKGLARGIPDCHYLEIGSLRGESVANVAAVASRCVALSLPPGRMKELGYSDDLIRSHHFYSRTIANVTHVEHDSQTFDFSTLGMKFDLVFIDGDHYDASVRRDTINAFQVLRGRNSLIVWHDYAFTPGQVRWSVLSGILEGMPEDKRRHLFHISNSQCAIYSYQHFASSSPVQPEMPDKSFAVSIRLASLASSHERTT